MTEVFPAALVEAAQTSSAWPFEEARKLVARLEKTKKAEVTFETGYGPSGLPHIGTFGEVARTTMVRQAFRLLTKDSIPTKLIAFSDDMDGLRKVPTNVPNQNMLLKHLGKPLTRVPDPFEKFESFAAHNNAMLRDFLDQFGFDYTFMSSTEAYTSGRFDAALLRMLERYRQVMAIMLPTFREERAASYSPFLPLHPKTGVVMQVPVEVLNAKTGLIRWTDPATSEVFDTLVTGGKAKLQWKPDWAMRWYALDIDYEMAGKDLIDSVKLSAEIVKALGGMPPEGFNYELFLDSAGAKISKSKGNGLTIEEWLNYAHPESLSLFMYQKPREAKRMHFDVIPRAMDDYAQFLAGLPKQDDKAKLSNPAWHIHGGNAPAAEVLDTSGAGLTFAMLLNLVAVANSEEPKVLWGFVQRYAPGVSPETHPKLNQAANYALRYYRDFVRPAKTYRLADDVEADALRALAAKLKALPAGASAEEIQATLYDVARPIPRYQDMKAKGATPERPGVSNAWFNTLYEILLGEPKGPRFGSFAALYGVPETVALIEKALSGGLVDEHAAFLKSRTQV